MLVHINDCIIMATSQPLIIKFKIEITKHVDISDLGELYQILGIKVHHVCEEHFSLSMLLP